MADKKISELDEVLSLSDGDLLTLVRSGVNYYATRENIKVGGADLADLATTATSADLALFANTITSASSAGSDKYYGTNYNDDVGFYDVPTLGIIVTLGGF